MADLLEQADDVQEALGRSYGVPDIDESELEAELEALGDEMLADEDSSYLDDAIAAPSAPDREPGAESVNKVTSTELDNFFCMIFVWLFFKFIIFHSLLSFLLLISY